MEKNEKGIVSQIEEKSKQVDSLIAQSMIQFDTMAEVQKEERLELNRMHNEEMDKMRKHYGRIILALILTLALLLGGIIGGVVYVLSNFTFDFGNSQETYDDSVINDGIHIGYPPHYDGEGVD